jgi:hypothetical protein
VPHKKPFQDYTSWEELLVYVGVGAWTALRRIPLRATLAWPPDSEIGPCRRCHLPALCRFVDARVEEEREQVDVRILCTLALN